MFWRKKKEEVENKERVFLPPPPSFYTKPKGEYIAMTQITLDAEKYDMRGQIEVRNALLIELKNSIDRVLEYPPVKDNVVVDSMNDINPSSLPKFKNPPPPPPPTFPKERTTKRG